MPPTAIWVIPCFNEEHRLDRQALLHFARSRPGMRLLLVDDGSTDGTALALESLRAAAPEAVAVLRLERNGGKAEAVRRGLVAALADRPRVVGYADADLATPPDELLRLQQAMVEHPVAILLAARVRLLGTRIERRAARHYLGRVFATLASLALGLPVYDTQCGAKLFACPEALAAALGRPFRSRWAFDVELLERLVRGGDGIAGIAREEMREVPLHEWTDVGGSKLTFAAMLGASAFLLRALLRGIVSGRAGGWRAGRARARLARTGAELADPAARDVERRTRASG